MSLELLTAAAQAACEIETAADELGTAYSAGQSFYGVGIECLIAGEWVKTNESDHTETTGTIDAGAIKAVRLFDCDGERGDACATVAEVEKEKGRWLGRLATGQS